MESFLINLFSIWKCFLLFCSFRYYFFNAAHVCDAYVVRSLRTDWPFALLCIAKLQRINQWKYANRNVPRQIIAAYLLVLFCVLATHDMRVIWRFHVAYIQIQCNKKTRMITRKMKNIVWTSMWRLNVRFLRYKSFSCNILMNCIRTNILLSQMTAKMWHQNQR